MPSRIEVIPDLGPESDSHGGPYQGPILHVLAYPRRRLRVLTIDPVFVGQSGGIAVLSVANEPLQLGPKGAAFEVDARWGDIGLASADLDDIAVLKQDGYAPDGADPRFHSQMVYGVAQDLREAFCVSLGRTIPWRFGGPLLRLRPFGTDQPNAWYDPNQGEVVFGYSRAIPNRFGTPVDTFVFTSLSSDIIAHEMTHALVDAVRPQFIRVTSLQQAAFHESLADTLALLQRFKFPELVSEHIRAFAQGSNEVSIFDSLAGQFAQGTFGSAALRTARSISEDDVTTRLSSSDHYELGSLLTSALMDTFARIVERKLSRFLSLPELRLKNRDLGGSQELLALLSDMAAKIAGHLRTMIIRALDFCPPGSIELGDFLRAMITADSVLVQDDPHGYRQALVAAFARWRIFPRHVAVMSQQSLRWGPPRVQAGGLSPTDYGTVPELALARMAAAGDPFVPASTQEKERRAEVLCYALENSIAFSTEAGLAASGNTNINEIVEPARVIAIDASRVIGPNGELREGTIAQVVQGRLVRHNGQWIRFEGGSALHFDQNGRLGLVVGARTLNRRQDEQRIEFMTGAGKRFWEVGDDGVLGIAKTAYQSLCGSR